MCVAEASLQQQLTHLTVSALPDQQETLGSFLLSVVLLSVGKVCPAVRTVVLPEGTEGLSSSLQSEELWSRLLDFRLSVCS